MADIWGTNQNDEIRCGSGNVALGLGGDDVLASIPGTGIFDQVLVGGIGNDTYYATSGAATVILDFSGAYDVLHTGIYLNDPTYLYTIGSRHLMMGDYASECFIMIPDVQNCGLEMITFASGEVYSFVDFLALNRPTMANLPSFSSDMARYLYDMGNKYTAAKKLPQNIGQDLPSPQPPGPSPVSPVDQATDTYFNAGQYLNNKLAALHSQGVNFTMEELLVAIANCGMTPLQHFKSYGAFEVAADGKIGIDPSALFDVSVYYERKSAQCNSRGENMDAAAVVRAFQGAGLDPISHYALYGKGEGVTPVPVVAVMDSGGEGFA